MSKLNDNQFYPFPPVSPDPYAPAWGRDALYNVPVISPVGNGPKGEKGDPTFFKDLTESEKAEIYKSVSLVGNEIVDAVFTTNNASTATIPIPIPDYTEYDLLWVFVEGLMLLENIDYTLFNGSIVLTSPISHTDTKVLFRALRFSTPDGNKNLNVNQHTTENNTYEYNAEAKTGTGAPNEHADYIGQLYIDTENDKTYIAKTTSGDWIQL